jgi:hypothetical protein
MAMLTCQVLKQVLDHELFKIMLYTSCFESSLVSMKSHLQTMGKLERQLTLQKQGGRLHDEEKCDLELCCGWLNIVPQAEDILASLFEIIKERYIGLPELTIIVVDCDNPLVERYIWNESQKTLDRQSLV